MHVTLWGTRGSLAAPGPDARYGGNTSCGSPRCRWHGRDPDAGAASAARDGAPQNPPPVTLSRTCISITPGLVFAPPTTSMEVHPGSASTTPPCRPVHPVICRRPPQSAAGVALHAALPRSPLRCDGDRGVDGHGGLCVPPRADGGLPDCGCWRCPDLYPRPRAGAGRSTVSGAQGVDLGRHARR